MRNCKNGTTRTQRRFHPVRRDTSRYGKVERALQETKDAGISAFDARFIACKSNMKTMQVAVMLRFTTGVGKGEKKGCWIFTGEDIRVENSVGGL